MTINKLGYVVENPLFYFNSETNRWYMDALGFRMNGTDYTGFEATTPIDGHFFSWIEDEGFKGELMEVDGGDPIAINEYFNASNSITSDIVAILVDITFGDDILNLLLVCQNDEYDDVITAFESATGLSLANRTKITVFEHNGDGTFTYVAEDEDEEEDDVDEDPDTRWQSKRDDFENSAIDGSWNNANEEGYNNKTLPTIVKETKKT